jgi:hypothetical protein
VITESGVGKRAERAVCLVDYVLCDKQGKEVGLDEHQSGSGTIRMEKRAKIS